jgi:hypothetical protein
MRFMEWRSGGTPKIRGRQWCMRSTIWTRNWPPRLVEDFPDAQFIHTIRDPITGIDSCFGRKLEMKLYACEDRLWSTARYLDIAVATMIDLLAWDAPQCGMCVASSTSGQNARRKMRDFELLWAPHRRSEVNGQTRVSAIYGGPED